MEKICKNCESFPKKPNWVGETHYCSSYDKRVTEYNKKYKDNLNHLNFNAPDVGVRPYNKACGFFKAKK